LGGDDPHISVPFIYWGLKGSEPGIGFADRR
jgi:hypothetical protein